MAKKAGKQAKKATDVKFPDAKELAKRLGTNKETFHEIIKKDIKKTFKNVLEARNIKNPDIGLDGLGNRPSAKCLSKS